ncbi:caspase family protein [Alienimonas sp. DA493]|uniref:caspase family protein n=1 Tax=Alienimonas sp. DA493 TaxID=3373605 RepID=UPI003754ED8A
MSFPWPPRASRRLCGVRLCGWGLLCGGLLWWGATAAADPPATSPEANPADANVARGTRLLTDVGPDGEATPRGAVDPAALRYGRCWAVVVGIDYDYTSEDMSEQDRKDLRDNGVTPLRNAEHDARAVRDALLRLEGYSEETVELLTGAEAEKGSILSVVEGVAGKTEPGDSLLFYFAGHGKSPESDPAVKEAALLPWKLYLYDGAITPSSYLGWSAISEVLENADAKHRLVVLDSCHSGAMFKDAADRGASRSAGVDPKLFAAEITYGIASTEADATAADGADGHSPFAQAFVSNLNDHRTGALGARRLAAGVYDAMRDGRVKQKLVSGPLTKGRDGEFYFFGSGTSPITREGPDATLAGLPGLSGLWWFEETPWLLPSLRTDAQFAAAVRPRLRVTVRPVQPDAEGTEDAAGASRGGAAAPCPWEHPAPADLLATMWEDVAAYANDRPLQEEYDLANVVWELRSFGWESADDAAQGRLIAEADAVGDAHLSAAVRHRLGRAEAGEAYERALFELRRSRPGTDRSEADRHAHVAAQALCRADYARWLQGVDRPREALREANRGLSEAARLSDPLPLLEIELLCLRALARRDLSDWDDARADYDAARRRADELPEGHPLRAHVRERTAWLLMDQWRLGEAAKFFEEARDLRARTELEAAPGSDAGLASKLLKLHDAHGLAMARRFAGQLDPARQGYQSVLEELSDLPAGDARGRELLALRRTNTAERLADSLLFAPVPKVELAAEALGKAFQQLDSLPPIERSAVQPRLLCKRAIVHAMLGSGDRAEADLREAGAVIAALLPSQRAEAELYRTVAGAAVCLEKNGCGPDGAGGERIAALRALLEDVDRRRLEEERVLKGTELEPLLAVGRALLAAQSKAASDLTASEQDRKAAALAARSDAAALYGLIPPSYLNEDSVRFLRPFLEATLQARLDDDTGVLAQLWEDVLRAKTGSPSLLLPVDRATILFLLYDTDGVALFRGAGGGWRLFQLAVGRAALKGEAPVDLPDELVTAMKEAGGGVAHWEDVVYPPASRPSLPPGWTFHETPDSGERADRNRP